MVNIQSLCRGASRARLMRQNCSSCCFLLPDVLGVLDASNAQNSPNASNLTTPDVRNSPLSCPLVDFESKPDAPGTQNAFGVNEPLHRFITNRRT